MVDEQVKRLFAEGKTTRARQLIREQGSQSAARALARPFTALLFVVVLVAVTAAVIYGMSFLGLAALEGLGPWLDPIVSSLTPLLFSATALAILGLVILVIGLPRAEKYRRPARFRGGIIALALAVGTFWPLQFLVSRLELPFWEWTIALHLLAGFTSICLLTGGLESIRMANNTPNDDSWEFLNGIR